MIQNGSSVLVFDANGAPIACQRNVDVTFNDDMIDVTCKQSNGYSEFLAGKRSFSMTCEALTDWGQNLLLWSEDFSNAVWVKDGITISANATIAPNGTTTADKVIASAIIGDKTTYEVLTVSNGVNYTTTVYYKASEYTLAWLRLGGVTNNPYLIYDLSTQTLVSSLGLISNSITDVGNGWYRITASVTTTSTVLAPNIMMLPSSGYTLGADNIPEFTGNGSDGGFIWGAQVNTGTTAQPYYQTTSTVNPNIDTLVSANLNRTKVELNIANPAFDDIYFNGEAYVESIELNAPTEDVSSYTVTFSGTGDFVSLVS